MFLNINKYSSSTAPVNLRIANGLESISNMSLLYANLIRSIFESYICTLIMSVAAPMGRLCLPLKTNSGAVSE